MKINQKNYEKKIIVFHRSHLTTEKYTVEEKKRIFNSIHGNVAGQKKIEIIKYFRHPSIYPI